MAHEQKKQSGKSSRPSWRLRITAASLIILVLLVVFLPTLVPRRWLRQRIVDQMQRDLSRQVCIDRISLGWFGGVRIENIEVQRRSGFGDGPLLTIRRFSCPFNPWRLLRNDLGRARITEGEFYYVLDADGRSNLDDLVGVPRSDGPAVDTVEVDDLTVHWVCPLAGDQCQHSLLLERLKVENDSRNETCSWSLSARQLDVENAVIKSQGCIGPRRFSADDESSSRKSFVHVSDIDLAASGVASWLTLLTQRNSAQSQTLALEDFTGRCSAKLTLDVDQNNMWQIAGAVELQDTTVTTGPETQTWLRHADILVDFHAACDFAHSAVVVSAFDFQAAGVNTHLSAHWTPDAQHVQFKSELSNGRFMPAEFAQAFPALADRLKLADVHTHHDGVLSFDAAITCTNTCDQIQLTIDAGDYALQTPQVSKFRAEPARLDCRLTLDRDRRRLACGVDQLCWPHLIADANATVALNDDFPTVLAGAEYVEKWMRLPQLMSTDPFDVTFNGSLHIDSFEQFVRRLPDLESTIRPTGLTGSIDLAASLTMPQGTVTARVDLPLGTSLTVADPARPHLPIFHKSPTQPLSLSFHASVDYPRALMEEITVDAALDSASVSIGPGRITLRETRPSVGPAETVPASPTSSLPAFFSGLTPGKSWQGYSLELPFAVADMDTLLAAAPALAHDLAQQGAVITQDCHGSLIVREDGSRRQIETVVDLSDLNLKLMATPGSPPSAPARLDKPVGQPCRATVSLDQNGSNHVDYDASFRLASISAHLRGSEQSTADSAAIDKNRRLRLELSMDECDQLTSILPDMCDGDRLLIGPAVLDCPAGALDLNVTVEQTGPQITADIEFIADDTSFNLISAAADSPADTPETCWAKQPHTTLRFNTTVNAHPTDADDLPPLEAPWRFDLAPMRLQIADSSLTLNASAVIDRPLPLAVSSQPETSVEDQLRTLWQSCRHATANLQTTRVHPDHLAREMPFFQTIADTWGLGGTAHCNIDTTWDRTEQQWRLAAQANLTATSVHASLPFGAKPPQETQRNRLHIEKPLGDQLTLDLQIHGALPASSVSNALPGPIELQRCALTLPGLTAQCTGHLPAHVVAVLLSPSEDEPQTSEPSSTDAVLLTLDVICDDLSQPAAWLPTLSRGDFAGHYRQHCEFAWPASAPVSALNLMRGLQSAQLDANVTGIIAETPFSVTVDKAQVTGRDLWAPRVAARLGTNDLTVSAQVDDLLAADSLSPRPLVARAEVLAQHLNLDDIGSFIERLGFPMQDAEDPTDSAPPDLTAMQEFLQGLRRVELDTNITVDQLQLIDAASRAHLDLRACNGQLTLQQARCQADFQAALSGGLLSIELLSDLGVDDPILEQKTEVTNLQATEALRPLVETEFPDLEVLGTISERRNLQAPLSRLLANPDAWSGEGETVLNEGLLHGPGGPAWLVRLMPNLKSVVYPWKQMINHFELINGTEKRNRLVFEGGLWDIFIDGISTPVQDPQTYQKAVKALYDDRDAALELLRKTEADAATTDPTVLARLRRRLAGLGDLIDDHEAGRRLRVTTANYQVGLLGGPLIRSLSDAPQRRLLRVPAFYTTGYIVGSHMVDVKTSSTRLGTSRHKP